MNKIRIENDTMGSVNVEFDKYWGAQTQRSLKNFSIGQEKIPMELIYALAMQKKAAALANRDLGKLDENVFDAIIKAIDDVLSGKLDDHFPLSVWQTGSGTQTHMNINEVISNRAIEILGGQLGSKNPVHPNNHVNMSQSSNDTFPTAMHIAAFIELKNKLLPSVERFSQELQNKCDQFQGIVKVGRTHFQDATPITLSQEFSGYKSQIDHSIRRINYSLNSLKELAQGGTAVGTGINCSAKFVEFFISHINKITGEEFLSANNKFEAISSCEALLEASSTLNSLASSIMKIINDIRFLSSGPRCGIGELILPSNEPGSSIMPGKVNPTQCEALSMVALQVMGYHFSITMGSSNGHFELNVFRPLIIYNFLNGVKLLSDAINSFIDNCLLGIAPNKKKISEYLNKSLMLVTSLNPHIGYDAAARIAKNAYEKDIDLKTSALELGLVSEKDFDKWVDPSKMV